MSNASHSFSVSPRTTAPDGFVLLEVKGGDPDTHDFDWSADEGNLFNENKRGLRGKDHPRVFWQAASTEGPAAIHVIMTPKAGGGPSVEHTFNVDVTSAPVPEALLQTIERGFDGLRRPGVRLEPQVGERSLDQSLWVAIRNETRSITFERYAAFIDRVLCSDDQVHVTREIDLRTRRDDLPSPLHGVDAYQLLKTATEAFLLLHCGVVIRDGELYRPDEEASRLKSWSADDIALNRVQTFLQQYLGSSGRLPYIDRIIRAIAAEDEEIGHPYCNGVLNPTLAGPCLLELIWSYWHEEGMLVQSLNAISLRFQNKRGGKASDPLSPLEIDPLRPLSNLLWGYVQDEPQRLTVGRRAYEYDHHYGLRLIGRAVPRFHPTDSRSKFLSAFHGLLNRTAIFYQEASDSTVTPDGFPMLNALKETHLVLAEGAHNQFRDLPWTARVEMLIQQWLLARPEMRDFLRGRAMVPYREPWMGQVDTMKKLQGWTDTGITHFNDLAVFGEQIVLSIRYGDWVDVADENRARNWALYWRPEIQGYIHAYRGATGVDLTHPDRVDSRPPSMHLGRMRRKKPS